MNLWHRKGWDHNMAGGGTHHMHRGNKLCCPSGSAAHKAEAELPQSASWQQHRSCLSVEKRLSLHRHDWFIQSKRRESDAHWGWLLPSQSVHRSHQRKNTTNSATMHVAVCNVNETDAILYPHNSIGLVSQASIAALPYGVYCSTWARRHFPLRRPGACLLSQSRSKERFVQFLRLLIGPIFKPITGFLSVQLAIISSNLANAKLPKTCLSVLCILNASLQKHQCSCMMYDGSSCVSSHLASRGWARNDLFGVVTLHLYCLIKYIQSSSNFLFFEEVVGICNNVITVVSSLFRSWFGWFLNVKLENSLLNWALQQPGHDFNQLPAPVSLLFKIGLLFCQGEFAAFYAHKHQLADVTGGYWHIQRC